MVFEFEWEGAEWGGRLFEVGANSNKNGIFLYRFKH